MKTLEEILERYQNIVQKKELLLTQVDLNDMSVFMETLQEMYDYLLSRELNLPKLIQHYKKDKSRNRLDVNIMGIDILLNEIERSINTLYDENIFILKKGDLEYYLDISQTQKSFENIIQKCDEIFSKDADLKSTLIKLKNEISAEFEPIIQRIFPDKYPQDQGSAIQESRKVD